MTDDEPWEQDGWRPDDDPDYEDEATVATVRSMTWQWRHTLTPKRECLTLSAPEDYLVVAMVGRQNQLPVVTNSGKSHERRVFGRPFSMGIRFLLSLSSCRPRGQQLLEAFP